MSGFTVSLTVVRMGGASRIITGALAFALLGGFMVQGTLAASGDRTPYQQFRSTSCTASNQCSVDFKPVPTNSRVEITNESCLFTSSWPDKE
jgi:hypothetical protein